MAEGVPALASWRPWVQTPVLTPPTMTQLKVIIKSVRKYTSVIFGNVEKHCHLEPRIPRSLNL
jgi:hypothetical protein